MGPSREALRTHSHRAGPQPAPLAALPEHSSVAPLLPEACCHGSSSAPVTCAPAPPQLRLRPRSPAAHCPCCGVCSVGPSSPLLSMRLSGPSPPLVLICISASFSSILLITSQQTVFIYIIYLWEILCSFVNVLLFWLPGCLPLPESMPTRPGICVLFTCCISTTGTQPGTQKGHHGVP